MFFSFLIFGSLPLIVFGICNYHFVQECEDDCDAHRMSADLAGFLWPASAAARLLTVIAIENK